MRTIDDRSPDLVVLGENLDVTPTLPDGAFTVVYLDPPFNTGRKQRRHAVTAVQRDTGSPSTITGFRVARTSGSAAT